MGVQVVMTRAGDQSFHFTAANKASVAKAEARFKELTGQGFTAAERLPDGGSKLAKKFNPKARETVFHPRVVGG